MRKLDHHCSRKTTKATKSVAARCKVEIRARLTGIYYRVSGGGIREIKGFRTGGTVEQVRDDLNKLIQRHSKEMSF